MHNSAFDAIVNKVRNSIHTIDSKLKSNFKLKKLVQYYI